MKFNKPNADFFVPDGTPEPKALARTTHLCVSAHQDDIEIMAYHGVAECFGLDDKWFTGVVITNGAGSPRSGIYARYSDEEMQKIRLREQQKAAMIGDYGCQIQLGYTSAEVKNPKVASVVDDLVSIFKVARPEVVYLHNPGDRHDTHVAAMLRAISALRALSPDERPKQVYGSEVWRGLDWLPEDDRRPLPVSERTNISAALLGIFDSQVSGGKRYDLATAGRRLANATYLASHATDKETALTIAMDLTPLINDASLSVLAYSTNLIAKMQAEIEGRLTKLGA